MFRLLLERIITGVAVAGGSYLAHSVAAQERGRIEQPKPFVDLMLPAPISRSDVDWYALILGFSEDQQQVLLILHEVYVNTWREIECEIAEPLHELATDAVSARSSGKPYEYADMLATATSRRQDMVSAVAEADSEFFQEIRLKFSEIPEVAWTRVVNDRRRSRASVVESRLPGAGLDVVTILRPLLSGIRVNEDLLAICDEYSRALSGPLERRGAEWSAHAAAAAYLAALMSDLGAGRLDWLTEEELQVMRDQSTAARVDLAKNIYREDKRLKEINARFVGRFQRVLPNEVADQFRDAVDQTMFPRIFPDEWSAEPLLRLALELDGLTDSQRESLRAYLYAYRQRHRHVSEKLTQRFEEWRDVTQQTLSYHVDQRNQYVNEMKALYDDRLGVSRSALAYLLEMLEPEQEAALPEVRRYEERLNRLAPSGASWRPP